MTKWMLNVSKVTGEKQNALLWIPVGKLSALQTERSEVHVKVQNSAG